MNTQIVPPKVRQQFSPFLQHCLKSKCITEAPYMNLPPLVLKARHLSGTAFRTRFSRLEVPEQALDGPDTLSLGLIIF